MILAPSLRAVAVAGQRPGRHPWPQTLRRLAPWFQRHVTSEQHAPSGGGRKMGGLRGLPSAVCIQVRPWHSLRASSPSRCRSDRKRRRISVHLPCRGQNREKRTTISKALVAIVGGTNALSSQKCRCLLQRLYGIHSTALRREVHSLPRYTSSARNTRINEEIWREAGQTQKKRRHKIKKSSLVVHEVLVCTIVIVPLAFSVLLVEILCSLPIPTAVIA